MAFSDIKVNLKYPVVVEASNIKPSFLFYKVVTDVGY